MELLPPVTIVTTRGQWILNKHLLKLHKTKESLTRILHSPTPNDKWLSKKTSIINTLKLRGQRNARYQLRLRQKLTSQISIVENSLDLIDIDPEMRLNLNSRLALSAYLDTLHERMFQTIQREADGIATRTRIKIHKGVRNLGPLLRAEQRHARSNTIYEIDIPNTNPLRKSSNTEVISYVFTEFYQNLYDIKPSDPEAQHQLLSSITRSINPNDANFHNRPISLAEITKAINSTTPGKAPGPDGLTIELYQAYAQPISTTLLEFYNDCYAQGLLPPSMNSATIKLIYKEKGSRSSPSNYRPISLLQTDFKIIAKVIATRIKPLLPQIIGDDQYGFVPGRHIDDPIRTCQLLVEYLKRNPSDEEGLALLFLDQEKAFDRVDHEYLYKCLERFGIPSYLISWIKILYKNPTANVSTNKTLGPTIDLRCGVRQGCPLSPLLYIISLEPLACFLRNDTAYQGLSVRYHSTDKTFQSLRFADDTCLVLQGQNDLAEVEGALSVYEHASGAKINSSKSELLPLGNSDISTWNTQITKLQPDAEVRYLGAKIGNSVNTPNIWSSHLAKLNTHLLMTLQLGLPLQVRVQAAQTFLTSQVRYTMTFTELPRSSEQAISKSIQNFALGKNRSFLNRNILELDHSAGGLRLPSISKIRAGYDMKFIREILSEKKPWHPLLMNIIEHEYGPGIQALDIFKNPLIGIKRTLPKHLSQVISTFRALNGRCTEQPTIQRLASRGINNFTNSHAYPSAGLNTLADILQPSQTGAPIALQDLPHLKATHRLKAKAHTHESLRNSLPAPATPGLLKSPAGNSAWQVQTHRQDLYHISRYPIHANNILWDQPKSPRLAPKTTLSDLIEITDSPTTNTTRQFPRLTTITDYEIRVNEETIPVYSSTPRIIYNLLSQSNNHSHSPIWSELNPQPEWPKIPNRRLHPALPPKLYDLRFKIMHNRLCVGPKARHNPHASTANPDLCPQCGEEDSIYHLFVTCPHISPLWQTIKTLLQSVFPAQNVLIDDAAILLGPPDPPDGDLAVLMDLMVSLMQHTIWTNKTSYLYRSEPFNSDRILSKWKSSLISNLTLCLKVANHHNHSQRHWKLTANNPNTRALLQLL
jgi:hypothetical protein